MKRPWYIEPAPHEASGNLIFTADDLQPFYALDRVVKDGGGSVEGVAEYGGEVYDLTLYNQQSGLNPWDDSSFRLESVREFRLHWKARDAVGERSGTFHVAPRWPEMKSADPDAPDPSTPDIVGVNVRFDGSNLPLDGYPGLLRAAAEAMDVNSHYFREGAIHEFSNVFAYERYVRIHRERSAALVGVGSPVERMFQHVRDGGGFRQLTEDDRGTEGYYHEVTFGTEGARRLLDGHRLAKRLKHYHPKHPRADAEGDDPLAHPKVGVAFVKRYNDDGAIRWSERDRLTHELDEQLVNTLSWAGLSVRADAEATYVPDAYFSAEESARDLTLIDDPTPKIRTDDRLTVMGLTGNPDLNRSDRDVLEVATAGGSHVDEVADEAGWSRSTVHRVVNRLSDLLNIDQGIVKFASPYLARVASEALATASNALAADASQEGIGDATGSFAEWRQRYGVEVDDPGQGWLTLRLGTVVDKEYADEILREGKFAWLNDGRKRRRYVRASIRYILSDGTPVYRQGFTLH